MEGQGKDCGLDGAPIPLHPGGEMSEKEEPKETIELRCLYCGKMWEFPHDGLEAQGILNVFCKDDDCEDKYAASL